MRPSTPKLSEAARHIVIPEGIVTTGWPAFAKKAKELEIGFDPWQHGLGTLCLGKRENGKYAATVGGIVMSIPRQVGKTYFVGALLIIWCILFPGTKVLWTAHRTRTSTMTFNSLQAMVKRPGIRGHLKQARNDGLRTANGEQEIAFANGSVIMFGAREQGFGRGFDAVDVEVFDEAQILTEKALEDMVAATNQSRHPHGALLFYMGTPPRPVDPGEAFTLKRSKALKGKSKDTVYVEMSADKGADPDDREQWAVANPSYPTRTPDESMLRLRENLPSDESWAREAYGIWDEEAVFTSVISAEAWAWLGTDGPPERMAPAAMAVDESHGGQISIAACWRIPGEPIERLHVEEVWAGGDRNTALAWLVARTERHQTMPIMIDSQSPAAALIPMLKTKKRNAVQGGAGDMAKACAAFLADVRTLPPKLSQGRQMPMAEAVKGAKQRNIGKAGGWGWDRTDPAVDISPLVAATLARHAASLQPSKPTRGPRRLR